MVAYKSDMFSLDGNCLPFDITVFKPDLLIILEFVEDSNQSLF